MKKILILLLVTSSFTLTSCFFSDKKVDIIASNAAQIDTSQASCPFVTKDNNGNIVLSWIRKVDSSTSVYCYAVSKDGGKSFGKTIVIPGTENVHPHGENMPKIIFQPSGGILAAWASANPNPKNPYSDLVYYSQSFDNGISWTSPEKLVKDTAGYDQRYFDLALMPNGQVAISWLDNRKKNTEEGSALYFAETSANKGFQNERLVSEPCCPCCRTDLFIDSKKNIHIVYRAIISDSIRDMVHTISTDDGKSFSAPQRISDDNWAINGCPHTGPAMTENKDGMQFTWFTGGGNGGIYYCHSTNEGESFSPRQFVSGTESRHSQITNIDGNKIAIAWNETFVKGKIFSSRIGIELRKADGNDPVREYITSEKGNASFPVIKGVNENAAFVAYTETVNDKDYVKYKLLQL